MRRREMIGDREVIVDDEIENPFRCPDCDVVDFKRSDEDRINIVCARCDRHLTREIECDGG